MVFVTLDGTDPKRLLQALEEVGRPAIVDDDPEQERDGSLPPWWLLEPATICNCHRAQWRWEA